MSLYHCLVPAGSLDADTRAALAEAITSVHAAVISVPRGFVNVVFTEYEPTAFYTSAKPNTVWVINGTIRAGHDPWMRGELLTRLSTSWCSITGHQPHQLLLILNEVDAGSSMEAGMMLPSFGEEAVWTQQHTRQIEEMRQRH
jgi:phenylpyruvate tautomerase PptA (4-oxalocrotonate tautomerase family)